MPRPPITLVTPALADANNGNWQTARRWARLLAEAYRVDLRAQWRPGDPAGRLLIALHARRSAASVAAWPADRPVLLVLTGTDLYRDIGTDAAAQASLARADALVVLNRLGADALPPALRAKAVVVLQSVAAHQGGARPVRHLQALAVGHLRVEKDPHTLWAAMRLLADRPDVHLDQIGRALDPALGAEAQALAAALPGTYRWLGERPHAEVRRRLARASVLVHPSRMEGGAHVVIEALRSGTPVLASRIDGNLGLLGADWPATFEPGDAAGLAQWLRRLRDDPALCLSLSDLARARAADFAPEREQAALQGLVARWLNGRR